MEITYGFIAECQKKKKGKAGVAIAIKKKFKRNIKHWEEINERIMKLEIELWGYNLVVIAVYSPTDDSNAIVKDDLKTN